MDFIHTREYLEAGDQVVVRCSHKCQVRVMDDANFQKYKNGLKHEFAGGPLTTTAPLKVPVPHLGFWNITLDLGGKTAQGVKYAVSFLKKRG